MNEDNKKAIDIKKERSYLFDNIKAILILSVVAAHYFRASASFDLPTFGGAVYIISFAYIMQGFLFVSGYFSRNLEKCRDTAFQSFLFPYLVLMPIMYCIRILLFGEAHFDITLPTMALWYLLTLFIYRYFLKDLVRINLILPISIAVSLAAGFILMLGDTLALGRTFGFLPFFLLGYYFKADWIEKLRKIPKAISWILLAGLLGFSIYTAFNGIIPAEAFLYKTSYAATGLTNIQGIGVRILLSMVSLAWIFVLITLMTGKKTFLSDIGCNTMTVYVLHIIVRYLIKFAGAFFGQNIPSYLILTCAALLSVWMFSRPAVVKAYNNFFDSLYQWVISIPLTLIRQIL